MIDRKKLAQIVFRSSEQLEILEKCIHPQVISEIKNIYTQINAKGAYSLFVVEIPLLFEIQFASWFDATIAITAPEKITMQRLQQQGHLTEQEYTQRMMRQLPPEKKAQLATFVIENTGDLKTLRENVSHIFYKLIKE